MTNSPTFVGCFADGQITRMTTHTLPDKLDVGRGVRLARHAYRSRMKRKPPPIVEAYFECESTRLATYDAEALKKENAS